MPGLPSNPNPGTPRAVPPSAAEVPERLREHYQFPGEFCAVSGFESIAKLEGFIRPDEFPLQCDRKNQFKGFEPAHRTFLDANGLDAKDEHFKTGAEAAAAIVREVNAGRFPLIAMPQRNPVTNALGYHVYLFAKHRGETLFIDPAKPAVILRGTEDLPRALDNWRMNHPTQHKTIHVLTYLARAMQPGAGRPVAEELAKECNGTKAP